MLLIHFKNEDIYQSHWDKTGISDKALFLPVKVKMAPLLPRVREYFLSATSSVPKNSALPLRRLIVTGSATAKRSSLAASKQKNVTLSLAGALGPFLALGL